MDAISVTAGSVVENATWLAALDGKPTTDELSVPLPPARLPARGRPLQRLGEVRRREGLPRGKIAHRLGISVRQVQQQEEPSSDISLSDLYRWQEALGVPAAELLHEPDGELSPPVKLRARLVRAMKTARLIEELAREAPVRRLIKTLLEQLIKAMPELKDTTAWPAVGHRRKQDELGQAFFRRLSLDFFVEPESPGSGPADLW
jgi:transcriptional regulator with XRE-family HTH domain